MFFTIFLYSCSSNQDVKPINKEAFIKKEQSPISIFKSQKIESGINIVNTAGREVFVLYNSVVDFLKNTDTSGVYFETECMDCQQVQSYHGHLLYGQQLELFTGHAIFHKEKIPINTSAIPRVLTPGDGKTVNFSFFAGKGRINYIRQSCNDADLYKVILDYGSGKIQIENVLNASFFEYDLDRNGKPEQYILANRNCTQELAIIQIL